MKFPITLWAPSRIIPLVIAGTFSSITLAHACVLESLRQDAPRVAIGRPEAQLEMAQSEFKTIWRSWKKARSSLKKSKHERNLASKAKEILTLQGTVWRQGEIASEIIIPADRSGSWLNRFAYELWDKQGQTKLAFHIDVLSDVGAAYSRPTNTIWLPGEYLMEKSDGIAIIAHEVLHARFWHELNNGRELMPNGAMFPGGGKSYLLEELFTRPFELRLHALKDANRNAIRSSTTNARISILAKSLIDDAKPVRKASQRWLSQLKTRNWNGAEETWKVMKYETKVEGINVIRYGIYSDSGQWMLVHAAPLPHTPVGGLPKIHIDLVVNNAKNQAEDLRLWITEPADLQNMKDWLLYLDTQKADFNNEVSKKALLAIRNRLQNLNTIASHNENYGRRIRELIRHGDPKLVATEAEGLVSLLHKTITASLLRNRSR